MAKRRVLTFRQRMNQAHKRYPTSLMIAEKGILDVMINLRGRDVPSTEIPAIMRRALRNVAR